MDWKISKPLCAILLSGLYVTVVVEHVFVDGTLNEANPGHKAFESTDDADGEGETGLIFASFLVEPHGLTAVASCVGG
ncbi:MAG: hypothetical protein E8D41_12145 [Nitrospira sp.]|nr:MAG: hypothetical protein E8D41_12145 [Nitrospira sp.]